MKRVVRLTVLAAACLALATAAAAQERADRIWSGGPIITMNDGAMRAEAVAEKGGKIVAVGPAPRASSSLSTAALFAIGSHFP